jgi:hypothetical protein
MYTFFVAYETIAWDQNIKLDNKMNLILNFSKFPHQEIIFYIFCVKLNWETMYMFWPNKVLHRLEDSVSH